MSYRAYMREMLLVVAAASRACGQQQSDPQALLAEGASLASQGRLAEAEVPLAQAALKAPRASNILTLLAQVKGRLGEAPEAAGLLRQVIDLEPRSATAHLNLAIALADSGDPRRALEQVERAIELEPRNAQAHLNRARMLAGVGRTHEARLEFAEVARLAPRDADALLFAATFEVDQKMPRAAIALLVRVVAEQPQNAEAYLLLGKSYDALHRETDAIAAWRHVIAIDPNAEEALYALAHALREQDARESARLLERFNRVKFLTAQADEARALGNQAYAAMQQQQWPAAVSALREALSVCGDCALKAGLHQRLGLAECHNGDLDGGEGELRLALSLDPNDRTAVDALHWVAAQRAALAR